MNSDQIGPPSGMKNLGPLSHLDLQPPVPNISEDAVTWIQEPEYPGTWTPLFTIPSLGQKMGWPREHKRLQHDDKMMMVYAFANDCAEYLFGKNMFLEVEEDASISFKPNPEFYA
ncbi:MAG: hypothetical protein ACO2ZD_00600 [Pseudomonadales bacterium]